MDDIFVCVDKLKKILRESKVYQDYLSAKKKLSDEDLVLIIKYKKEKSLASKNFDHEKFVSNLYSQLILRDSVRNFFGRERELIACVKKIYIKIGEDLEIDVFA